MKALRTDRCASSSARRKCARARRAAGAGSCGCGWRPGCAVAVSVSRRRPGRQGVSRFLLSSPRARAPARGACTQPFLRRCTPAPWRGRRRRQLAAGRCSTPSAGYRRFCCVIVSLGRTAGGVVCEITHAPPRLCYHNRAPRNGALCPRLSQHSRPGNSRGGALSFPAHRKDVVLRLRGHVRGRCQLGHGGGGVVGDEGGLRGCVSGVSNAQRRGVRGGSGETYVGT